MSEEGNFRQRLADALAASWSAKARPSQRLPPGDWSIWLLMAGRGYGKSRVLSEVANHWASTGQYGRMAIVGPTASDVRDVMIEGESGILATAPAWCLPSYLPTRRQIRWPNGALATLYSGEEPDRLRGPQHDACLCDELGAWRVPETWDMLMFGLRLGQHPRTVVACTPRPTKLLRGLIQREGSGVVVTRGTSYENRANLAPGFFDSIVKKYEGTRLGRQELEAELLEDTPGALWTLDMIDRSRRDHAPELVRVVVAIDPAVSTKEGSDQTGIIVAGKDERGHGYVLEDLSGRYQPADWARTAIQAYYRHAADRVVAEINNGGDLVENTLRTVDPNLSYSSVHASRGKYTRAEPVAALYEQSKVHHAGTFPELEDQMANFVPDLDRPRTGSPDRADAMVWAMTELLVERVPYQGLFQYYRELLGAAKETAAATGSE
jgi:phage terminase large subunit-like protein